MGTINYAVLRKELIRDPIELGYSNKTPEKIVELINQKQFSEAAMFDAAGNQVFYAVSKTSTGGSITNSAPQLLAMTNEMQLIKRSRAELLFGTDTYVSVEDIDLAR
jgi:hypothetical protein